MKEYDQIKKMKQQGKLSAEQAELLTKSLKTSKTRKTKLKKSNSDEDEISATAKIWKKEGVRCCRALITNELERKEALVPQIQESVSTYAGHEADTLEKVIHERSSSDSGTSSIKLDQVSVPINALAEKYPEIKADQVYTQLFDQLVETENRITAMVQWYNHKVGRYNSAVDAFPFFIVAEVFSFKKADYIENT